MSAAGGAGMGGLQRPQDGGGRGAPRGAVWGQPPARRPGRLLRRRQVRPGAACGVSGGLSPQGGHGCRLSRRRFLLCTAGDFVKVYSAATEELVRLLRGHSGLVTGVRLNPHNRLQVGQGAGAGLGRGLGGPGDGRSAPQGPCGGAGAAGVLVVLLRVSHAVPKDGLHLGGGCSKSSPDRSFSFK